MRIVTYDQGSPEWINARLGRPTASNFDKLITPRTLKPSASAEKYLLLLLAEWVTGRSLDEGVSQFMMRGTAMEDDAAAFYELERDVTLERVGFCATDDGWIGASPDRLVGEEGLVEIKVPALTTHLGYLLGADPEPYLCQAQGQMWVTGRQWVDLLSYNPDVPPVIRRFERDEAFMRALTDVLADFVGRLKVAREDLLKLGVVPVPVDEGVKADLTAALTDVLA